MSINNDNDLKIRAEKVDYEKDLPDGKQAEHNAKLHKRLDDLMEEKRLKELLDGTEDLEL